MSVDKKKFALTLLFAGNLIFFASTFYFMQDNQSLQEQLKDLNANREKLLTETETLRGENKRLQNRPQARAEDERSKQQIESLESLLDRREEEIAALRRQLPGQTEGGEAGRRAQRGADAQNRGRGNRQLSPEQSERMQARREEMQKRLEEQSAKREYFFKNLDVSQMSAEQRGQISRYQELLANQENLFNAPRSEGQRPDFTEMMQRANEIAELSVSVKETLLQNLARQLGTPEESFSNEVNEILEHTTSRGTAAFGSAFSQREGFGRGGRRPAGRRR
ncbi:MAG: hypothetical protein RBT25_00070 [Lentisphaeria bacterium]|nr:hypothetical protein [Lentisphaeria bacterium]